MLSCARTKVTYWVGPGQIRVPPEWAVLRCRPILGSKPMASSQTELNAGLETSEQESGILVAEFLGFLWRESVSSEPEGDKA